MNYKRTWLSKLKKKHKDLRLKVFNLYKDAVGERADSIKNAQIPEKLRKTITNVLRTELDKKIADRISFHLLDWTDDAAFIMALILWPDKFTKQEISDGIYCFMPHVPDHLAAAAKLFGTPVTDVFEVGALDGE
ncbi:MAG TPA: hypothetical protein VLX68_10005 [Chitinivibrionales bacterium]|nr:hypothetical protein [Chitinivibrionales bacterium]